jgi:hypothetical protein
VSGTTTSGIGVFGATTAKKYQRGYAGYFQGPVMVDGSFTVMNPQNKHAVISHSDGSHRLLYCMESTESWIEDFGEASLVRGKARVKPQRDFAGIIKSSAYHIFLTPYGDSEGLFVSRRTATGFEVSEQKAGKSNLKFSYRPSRAVKTPDA